MRRPLTMCRLLPRYEYNTAGMLHDGHDAGHGFIRQHKLLSAGADRDDRSSTTMDCSLSGRVTTSTPCRSTDQRIFIETGLRMSDLHWSRKLIFPLLTIVLWGINFNAYSCYFFTPPGIFYLRTVFFTWAAYQRLLKVFAKDCVESVAVPEACSGPSPEGIFSYSAASTWRTISWGAPRTAPTFCNAARMVKFSFLRPGPYDGRDCALR